MKTYRLTRTVTLEECSWLDREFKQGEIVYEYMGCTYGCVSNDGKAVTEQPNQTPFTEIPRDAIEAIAA